MTDEEKKAIKGLEWSQQQMRLGNLPDYDQGHYADVRIVLNLIEKQSKEIEHQIEKRANQRNELAILNAKQIEFNKLVNIVNSYKGQFKRQQKEIEELTDKNKKLKDKAKELIFEKQELTSGLLDSTPNDKIKAKIEELDYNDIGNFERRCKQEVLQSLLEKE